MRAPARRGDDRLPVLPPIRDWFRDELSRPPLQPNMSGSAAPHQPSKCARYPANQTRGLPGPSSNQPPSPPLAFYHSYPSYPDPSFSHVESISQGRCVARRSYPLTTQSVPRAGMQVHHQEHSLRQVANISLHAEAPLNVFPPAIRPDAPQPARAPPPKYECNYCGKTFNRPSSLKTHFNTHTGEKPFICPLDGCGRAFSVQSNMRRHARVHTQLSPRSNSDSSGEDGVPRLKDSPPQTP